MKSLLLLKIRLTTYFVIFLFVFTIATILLPKYKLESSALTLFSVNSFLYGFYIAPILSGQKSRIEELHKIIRAEANSLFAMALKTKPLDPTLRTQFQEMLLTYMKRKIKRKRPDGGELEYEAIIGYCLNYSGKNKEEIAKLLDLVVANQQNRTNLNMQLNNKVFSNEWMVMFILFSITLGFILTIDTGGSMILELVRVLLSTGLTMLIIIVIKLSTLTHKKAKEMWNPLQKLSDTHFYRFD